jgi:hypothetical protein
MEINKFNEDTNMNPMAISNALIERMLNFFRSTLDAQFFEKNEARLENIAKFATPFAAGVGLLLATIVAIKTDSFSAFVYGVAWVLMIAVAYYIGSHFLDACKLTVKNNPSTISTAEYLDTLGLMAILALVGVVVGSLIFAIKTSSIGILQWAVPLAIALLSYICLFLNPKLISTDVKKTAIAGEDALSVMVVLYKSAVKLAGIAFGGLTSFGAIVMLAVIVGLLKDNAIAGIFEQGMSGIAGTWMVIGGLLFPFAVYVGFILFHLVIDLCRAILSLNKK